MKELPTNGELVQAYVKMVNTLPDESPLKAQAEMALRGTIDVFKRYLADTGTIYHYSQGEGQLYRRQESGVILEPCTATPTLTIEPIASTINLPEAIEIGR